MRRLIAICTIVLLTSPALAQQTLKPGTYKVPPAPSREQVCGDMIAVVNDCAAKRQVCEDSLLDCENAPVPVCEECPAPPQATVCLQPVLGAWRPDHLGPAAPAVLVASRPWYKDWRAWAAIGGAAVVGAILQHNLDDDEHGDVTKNYLVVLDQPGPDSPCWPHPHGRCK